MDPVDLLGAWRLDRVIEDRAAGATTTVDGSLALSRVSPDEVTWEERATWHRPGGDVPVSRSLRLVRVDDAWWVRFEDGRDFHPWVVGREVVHDCRPDTYRGTVSGTPEEWSVVWQVAGPHKDYTMTTVLRPR